MADVLALKLVSGVLQQFLTTDTMRLGALGIGVAAPAAGRIQTSGDVTFGGVTYADGGIDRSTAAALALGATTASSLTLGRTGISSTFPSNLGTTGNPTFLWAGSGTFGTSTGAVSINGAVTMAAGMGITAASGAANFDWSASSGTFKTGTGAVSISGATTATSTLMFTVGSASFASSQNNYAIPATVYIRLTASNSSLSLTGMTGGVDGRIIILMNGGVANSFTLANESASSTDVNRINTGTGSNLTLTVAGSASSIATLIYDGTGGTAARWRVIAVR